MNVRISRFSSRHIIATVVSVLGFVLLYEATIRDSRSAREASIHDPTAIPMAGSRLQFNATAYCKGTTTASGVNVRTGIAASDPMLLPVGSVVSIATQVAKYNGVYTIMDTGPKVQGRILDLYMWSCHEALAFGRKEVQVTVLRLGWNPRASSPSLISTLFRRREQDRAKRPLVVPPASGTAPPAPPPPPALPPLTPLVLPEPSDAPADAASMPPEAPPVLESTPLPD